MKKKRSPTMIIAFLDTLSNAMAAILIIAIIQLHPKSGEGVAKGLYFVKAYTQEIKQDYNLEMIMLTDTDTLFSELQPIKTNYRFLRAGSSITMLVTEKINANIKIQVFLERVIVAAPDTLQISIDASLPERRAKLCNLDLTKFNNYKVEIPEELLR